MVKDNIAIVSKNGKYGMTDSGKHTYKGGQGKSGNGRKTRKFYSIIKCFDNRIIEKGER